MFMKNILFVINKKIDEIILLQENYIDYKKTYYFPIKYYNNINECLDKCDCTIIFKDNFISRNIIEQIKFKCKENNVKIIVIDLYNMKKKKYSLKLSNDKPIIFNISFGERNLIYSLEMLISKILLENDLLVKQKYCQETNIILNNLRKTKILNEKIYNNILKVDEKYDIIICTYELDANLNNINELLIVLNKLQPDCIIFLSNIKKFNRKKIEKAIYYCCDQKIDFFINSGFYCFDDKVSVYCNKKVVNELIDDFMDYKQLEKKLFTKIISKLSLPEGIYPL